MRIKTSEATGCVLDWLVAQAGGLFDRDCPWPDGTPRKAAVWTPVEGVYLMTTGKAFCPSANWAQGGPIIELEKLVVGPSAGHRPVGVQWTALRMGVLDKDIHRQVGPTPLVAATRCFVASRLGDEVDVPEELL